MLVKSARLCLLCVSGEGGWSWVTWRPCRDGRPASASALAQSGPVWSFLCLGCSSSPLDSGTSPVSSSKTPSLPDLALISAAATALTHSRGLRLMKRTLHVMRVTDTQGESECPEDSTGVRGRENNRRGWEGRLWRVQKGYLHMLFSLGDLGTAQGLAGKKHRDPVAPLNVMALT